MNETSSFENFIIKSEYENNKAQKLNSNNLAAFNQTQYKSALDNDDDIIWIFDKYNEQKIDDNVFIDLTNDDHLNLLLDSNNLDLFINTPALLTPTYPVHNLSTITINEVKNEAKCVNQNLNFKCESCNKTFKKKFNYKRHVIIHKNEFPYTCNHCDQKFKDESNSRKHLKHCKMKLVTNTLELQTITHTSNTLSTNNANNISNFKCDLCEKQFYKKYNLIRHKNMHKLNDFKNNNTCSYEQYDYEDNENNDIRYYECKICNKKFNELKQLNLHDKNYHIECSEIECSICKEKFNIKYNYLVHELACKEKSENKTNNKTFKCSICKKNFPKIYNLKRHLATRHQNKIKNESLVKKYVCEYCSRSFYEFNKLKSHSNKCKFADSRDKD